MAKDLPDLCRVHYILNGCAEILALATLALGVYWMEIMILWTSQLIQAVMWSGVLLVTLGALEMTFGFMGISAVQTKSVGVVYGSPPLSLFPFLNTPFKSLYPSLMFACGNAFSKTPYILRYIQLMNQYCALMSSFFLFFFLNHLLSCTSV